MADQVNPLGSLAAGVAQTLQVLSTSSSAKTPSSIRSVDSEASPEEPRTASVSQEDFTAAAKSVSELLQQSSTETRYGVDQETGLYYFKIIDSATKETIRQVPPEEILTMARRLRAFLASSSAEASGILVDRQG